MFSINERFRIVFKESGLSQEKFAEKINRSRGEVANIIYDKTAPKDMIIKATCDAFMIREDWLRNGNEPMYLPKTNDDVEFINELLAASENPFMDLIKSVMKVYMELSPEDKKKAMDFAHSLKEKVKESQD